MSPLSLLLSACWLTLAAARSAPPYLLEHAEQHFESFIQKYDRRYADEHEKQIRLQIFKENLEKVNQMNERSNLTVFGITKFMDLTSEEFVKTYTSLKMPGPDEIAASGCQIVVDKDIVDMNETMIDIDYKVSDITPLVMDQGLCLASYAFSAAGNIMGQYGIKYGKHVDLSVQQIIDCTAPNGCSGGNSLSAFRSIIERGGIEAQANYPYTENNNECRFNKSNVKVKVADCRSYNLVSQRKAAVLLYNTGPLSIAVRATNFQFYDGGVMEDAFCNHGEINHALLLYGYVAFFPDITAHWLALSSWGENWGNGGSIYIQTGESRTSCGMMNPLMSSAVIRK